MKLPRWLVIAMLTASMLSVLAAAGWWWVTWPERTIAELHACAKAGKNQDFQRLFGDRLQHLFDGDDQSEGHPWHIDLKPVPRNLADVVRGRQDFEGGRDAACRFRVERGRVVDLLGEFDNEWKSIIDLIGQ